MPIYEYRCNNCNQFFSIFLHGFNAPESLSCTKCGYTDLRKLVSRFSVVKSEESRIEALADPSAIGDLDENDPRSIARWARKMGEEMGEDLGDDFDEMVDRMEAGEMPEDMADGESPDNLLD
ncbi:MAG: zinc ribbon domain-containing protein [Chloroflexi bacterium]|nr:zinc ribbon domain-containing protein [Chloroflexota bacterium]